MGILLVLSNDKNVSPHRLFAYKLTIVLVNMTHIQVVLLVKYD